MHPLHFGNITEPEAVTRDCLKNLRLIAEVLHQCSIDVAVRLVLIAPRENIAKWALGLGVVGAAMSVALDADTKRKVSALIEQGQIRDAHGTIVELAESQGWEVVVA